MTANMRPTCLYIQEKTDFPVQITSTVGSLNTIDRVIFPISSEICMILFEKKNQVIYGRNELRFIDCETRDKINVEIAYAADRNIFPGKK